VNSYVGVTLVVCLIFGTIVINASCDGSDLIGPENELEVTNVTDYFEFQVTALNAVTDSLTYSWENTGTCATFDQAHHHTGGRFTIAILDADSRTMALVFRQCDSECGGEISWSSQTQTGTPGKWTVAVSLRRASGDIGFSLQKADP